jgi:RHS repeat-associated protein
MAFDGVGNLRSRTVNGTPITNTANLVNEGSFDGLLDHNGDNDAGGGAGSGGRTRDPGFIYQWDGVHRVRTLLADAGADAGFVVIARYNYDAELIASVRVGRRVQKIVENRSAQDAKRRFYWDDTNMIEETLVDGGQETTNRQYIFGRGANNVQVMHADIDGGGALNRLFFMLKDSNNNVTELVESDGTPVEFYSYDDKGKPSVLNPDTLQPRSYDGTDKPLGNPWLFTSHHFDYESDVAAKAGHYYMKARFYDAEYGVFMSRDPKGMWGDPANFGNAYTLTGNDPVNRQDPNGLDGEFGAGFDEMSNGAKASGGAGVGAQLIDSFRAQGMSQEEAAAASAALSIAARGGDYGRTGADTENDKAAARAEIERRTGAAVRDDDADYWQDVDHYIEVYHTNTLVHVPFTDPDSRKRGCFAELTTALTQTVMNLPLDALTFGNQLGKGFDQTTGWRTFTQISRVRDKDADFTDPSKSSRSRSNEWQAGALGAAGAAADSWSAFGTKFMDNLQAAGEGISEGAGAVKGWVVSWFD